MARGLRTDRTHAIGVITDDITSPFSPLIIRGIQDRLKEAGYTCVIVSADWDPDIEREAIHDLVSRSIDGVIFVESWHRSANETLDLAGRPYVFVHRQFDAGYRYSVAPDEVYGAKLAVQHLMRLGHVRIGFVNGPIHFYASTDRLQGYREAITASGIAFDEQLVAAGRLGGSERLFGHAADSGSIDPAYSRLCGQRSHGSGRHLCDLGCRTQRPGRHCHCGL